MSKKFVQPGKTVALTAPEDGVVSGTPYLIGNLFGVAQTTIAEGDEFPLMVEGVHELPKQTGVTFDEGDPAYWDDTAKNIDVTTTNNVVGSVVATAASGDTTVWVRLSTPVLGTYTALGDRLTAIEEGRVVKQMAADGTQVAMTVSDTYVNFTADALTFDTNGTEPFEDNDTFEWEVEVFLDAMNAAMLVTFSLLIGALELDVVAITTGDTNDWAKLAGTGRLTAIGASTTIQIAGGEGCNSDGGIVTRDTPTLATGTGPATTSDVVFTPRIKAATGNAGNLATLRNFKVALDKAS